MSTTVEQSWAVDFQITNNKVGNSNNDIYISSLNRGWDQYKRAINEDNDNLIDESSSANIAERSKKVSGLFEVPNISRPVIYGELKNYFANAQRWVGHITEINETSFIAQLKDLNDPTTHEIGEFDIDEISVEDREFVVVGGTFYWSIGTANRDGQKEKKSLIRFQRLTPWSKNEYDRAIDRASELYNGLNWA